jgi:hypothetical protein
LPDFSSVQHSKTGENEPNIPNDNKIYQMAAKKQKAIKYISSSIAGRSKIYPNWKFFV